jgi:raw score 2.41
MEDKRMVFYLMVASMLLGLFALKIGFSHFKEKKDKFLSILTSLAGTALVLVAIWLGWPK